MKRFFLLTFLLLVLAGAAAYFAVPWNSVLEQRVIAFLNSRGVENVTFEIKDVGLHQVTLSNIQIGQDNPLLLQSVTVNYSPRELMDGNIEDILLTGLDIQIRQTDEGWVLAGFEDFKGSDTPRDDSQALLDIVDLLPFSTIKVEDSYLKILGQSFQTALPFNMQLTKNPKISLDLTINASNLTLAASEVALGVLTVKAQPDKNRHWNGEWALSSLNLGEEMAIPVLNGNGTLFNEKDIVTFKGALASADKTYKGSFSAHIDLKASNQNSLTVQSASFPFKEGLISAKNVTIPFDRKKNITLNIDVKKVSLNALLQTLTGERVSATGTVSGRMPVILRPDGSYTLGKGSLKADSSGLIQMPPEAIPGDNEQVQLVRNILDNLHYSVFSASVDTSGSKGLMVKLSLEGNNPDVYNGRIVKLNVNLTGDVLDFIQQNAMLFTSPEKLLQQGMQ